MAKENNKQARPTLGMEIAAVCCIFAAFFLLLCYMSYSLPDSAGMPSQQHFLWGGKVGYFIARFTLGFIGVTSFWVPVFLLVFSYQFFLPGMDFRRLPSVIAGCTGLLVASSVLFGSLGVETVEIFGRQYPATGYIGKFLFVFFDGYFGGPGTILVFAALFTVSLMVSVRFSPYFCGHRVLQTWWWFKDKRSGKDRTVKKGKCAPNISEQPTVAAFEENTAPRLDVSVPKVREPVRVQVDDDNAQDFQLLPIKSGDYQLPHLNLLEKSDPANYTEEREYYYSVSKELEAKLLDFGVSGKVVGISPGPVITTYEFSPAPGVKINRIVSLADDIALGLKAESVRIVGSVPGKAALGIEIPNPERQIVYVRDIFANEKFQKAASKLTIGLGMDVVGNPVVADLSRMPHLLIAGATGSGKSVAVNAIICSILFHATPDEVRLLLVDPKRIELSCYEAIPHLLHPVVVDPKLASRALLWAVREMERRYALMEEAKVKSLASYNNTAETKLPLIVIIIDELADLMMVSSREVEDAVARLAQMARAAGMHLILAT